MSVTTDPRHSIDPCTPQCIGATDTDPVACDRHPADVHAELLAEQEATLATPRRRYGIVARSLFAGMDLLYGRQASLRKFAVLELVARVPYQTWEHAAYLAITRRAGEVRVARAIHERVCRARGQQDNEPWHLFILEELLERDGVRLNWFKYRLVPQAIATVYYAIAFAMYLVRPRWSYSLNADFEDHAEHEYMAFVAAHPGLERSDCSCTIAPDYGTYASVADVLRRIGLDEREHKLESLHELGDRRSVRYWPGGDGSFSVPERGVGVDR